MCENLPRRGRLGSGSKARCWFDMLAQANSFRGFKAIGIFLFFGAAMGSLVGATLIWRGSFLDRLWALNARAYHQLAPFGSEAGVAFLVLGAVLVIAGRGWFLRRSCGWRLAAVLVASQTVGSGGERHPGRFLGRGNRVDSCGRDPLFSSPSTSANRFPQEGFSRASRRVSRYLSPGDSMGREIFRLARLRARKVRAFQSAK